MKKTTRSAIQERVPTILIWFTAVVVVTFLSGGLFGDSTDASFVSRSGLRLYIDEATGCHYVGGSIFGGLKPRRAGPVPPALDGEHICTGRAGEAAMKDGED